MNRCRWTNWKNFESGESGTIGVCWTWGMDTFFWLLCFWFFSAARTFIERLPSDAVEQKLGQANIASETVWFWAKSLMERKKTIVLYSAKEWRNPRRKSRKEKLFCLAQNKSFLESVQDPVCNSQRVETRKGRKGREAKGLGPSLRFLLAVPVGVWWI